MHIKTLFERFLNERQKHSPSRRIALNPPASVSQIMDVENKLGLAFPQDLRDLLLYANGQADANQDSVPLFPYLEFGSGAFGVASCAWFNSVQDIELCTLASREEFRDMAEERFDIVGPASYHDRTIAFTTSGNSDSLELDLRPSDGGTIGQVLCVSTQPCQIDVLAPSLADFLEHMLDNLLSGEFEINDGELYLFVEPPY